jgi:hypothetical protein
MVPMTFRDSSETAFSRGLVACARMLYKIGKKRSMAGGRGEGLVGTKRADVIRMRESDDKHENNGKKDGPLK